MSEISLREYRARAKELLDTGKHDQAIVICQHILRHYPKDVMTYQLLGEICLDRHDYSQAIDFFQRVLSADPENFIARVGLSICYEEGGSLEEAIWQLERAFELNPGSVEVRNELRRLYGLRDGGEVAKIKLNAGALGRLYAKGEFFQLAVNEFRALLERDPQLVDIQLALAETLWRDDKRTEAAQLCSDILEKLPHCLKANLILADILMKGEHPEEGEAKLTLARELDPAGTLAQELLGELSPLPPAQALLPPLDEAQLAAAPEPTPAPTEGEEAPEEEEEVEWLHELEEAPLQETAPAAEEAEGPEWLLALRTGTVEAEAAEEAAVEEAEIPAWLQELRQEQPEEEEEVAPFVEEVPVEAEAAVGASPPVREAEGEMEIPEWLHGLVEEEAEAEAEGVPAMAGPPVAEPAEEIPEWLQQLEPQAVEEEEAPQAEEEEIPAWLRELREELPPEPEEEEAEAAEEAEVPTWLQELAAEPVEEEEPGPVVTGEKALSEEPAAEPAEEIPEWLLALKPEEAEAEEPIPPEPVAEAGKEAVEEAAEMAVEEPGAEAGEGLIVEQLPPGASFEELVAEVAPELADQLPQWMEAEGVEEEATVAEAEPPTAEEELPEWLREAEPPATEEIAEQPPALEVEEAEIAEEAAVTEAPAPAAEELPAWLRDLAEEEEVALTEPPAVVEEELPAWLAEEQEGPELTAEVTPAEAPAMEAEEVEEVEEAIEEEVPPFVAPVAEAELEGEVEEEPEWLRDLRRKSAEEPLAAEPGAEVPEWLQELEPALPEEEIVGPPAAEVSEKALEETAMPEEIPEWLREVREASAALEEEVAGAEVETIPPMAAGEGVPEWLRELKPVIPDEELVEGVITTAPEVGEGAEWLHQVEEAEEAPTAEEEAPRAEAERGEVEREGIPPWLQEMQAVEEIVPSEAVEEEPAVVGLGAEEEEEEEEEAPEWLRELEAEVEKLPPELFAPAVEETTPEEEAPLPAEAAEEAEELEEFPPELFAAEAEELVTAEEPAVAAPPPPAEVELEEFPPELFAPPEEVAAAPTEVAPPAVEAVEEEVVAEAMEVTPPVAEEVAEESALRQAEARVEADPHDHHSRLALARAYRDAARWADALAQYEQLVKAGALVDAVIADMEQVIEEQPADHTTYMVLGDAYMKDGRLQLALAAYREAMARL